MGLEPRSHVRCLRGCNLESEHVPGGSAVLFELSPWAPNSPKQVLLIYVRPQSESRLYTWRSRPLGYCPRSLEPNLPQSKQVDAPGRMDASSSSQEFLGGPKWMLGNPAATTSLPLPVTRILICACVYVLRLYMYMYMYTHTSVYTYA